MKLPSINKPSSASSLNRQQQLPPRQNNNAISNLEKNLFNKLNEYDDLNKIETKKVTIQEPKYTKRNDDITNDYIEQKRQPTIKNNSQTEKIKDSKQINQAAIFLTHNQQTKSEESQSEKDDTNSDSSVEELLQKSRVLDKQKKLMLNLEDDSDVGQLNKMFYQTDIEMDEQFQSICLLRKTISQMNDSMKEIGFGIKNELLDELNQQYEEMLKLQRESQAVEEYQMRDHKNKMPALRSNSVNQQKKKK